MSVKDQLPNMGLILELVQKQWMAEASRKHLPSPRSRILRTVNTMSTAQRSGGTNSLTAG
jgi:hypothetical protein